MNTVYHYQTQEDVTEWYPVAVSAVRIFVVYLWDQQYHLPYCSTFCKISVVLKGANLSHFPSNSDATKPVQGRKGMIKDPDMKEVG